MASKSDNIIAFQGLAGAYSDLACRAAQPKMTTLPCPSFEDAFAAVKNGDARLAMIPIENSLAGRVADIHHLLPEAGLHIIGEHFQRVNHCLMAPKGATLAGLKTVESHVQALSQCRKFTKEHRLKPVVRADTAGSAADVAERKDKSVGAIASSLAAEIYGLDVLATDIEDADHNTTRMVVMARDPIDPDPARARSSPASCSACARCRPRSTRRSAASPPTASTSPSWKAT